MKGLWKDSDFKNYSHSSLSQRVYSSRILGANSSLVLHGGGNTSVKAKVKNEFGETDNILFVKGSGWDLATIEEKGFAGVKMEVLLKMARMSECSDSQMVRMQKAAMIDPSAPNPSVEAILHAIIPFDFVDHTHADAVVAVSNSPNGENRIREIYGDRVLYIPYVMPGFILAKKVYEITKDINWQKYDGMVLLNHGIFSFGSTAQESYERMITLVTKAEEYLIKENAFKAQIAEVKTNTTPAISANRVAEIRKLVGTKFNTPIIVKIDSNQESVQFSNLSTVKEMALQGPLTPDHVIQTKRIPMYIDLSLDDPNFKTQFEKSLNYFETDYVNYFNKHKTEKLKMLDTAPRWMILKNVGKLCFGKNLSQAKIISDITDHSIAAFQWSQSLGGYKALSEKDIFDVEYWELEQAKLSQTKSAGNLVGKIALVTGAASGIGKTCVDSLTAEGACVAALDINTNIKEVFLKNKNVFPIICDVTNSKALEKAIQQCVYTFGGLDIVVANAGMFPKSAKIEEMNEEIFEKTLQLNLTSQMNLIKYSTPFLREGFDPTIIVIASKNVPAPGPGASAYSASNAGLTQLARIAALELAKDQIRVNMLHPHAVMDTAIWTQDVLESQAKSYGMTVEEYKKSNLLKVEINSLDVANLVAAMAGKLFSKITGAQITIDGGSDRTI